MTMIEMAVFDLAGTTVKDTGLVESTIRAVTGDAFDSVIFRTSRGAAGRRPG